jgi:DNA primase
MMRAWGDYRAVKAAVSMEMALASYGIQLHRLDRDYLRGCCPLPVHSSKSSRQSFIVNTGKNAWACHSDSCVAARGGRIGGNVLDFISTMENCSMREAALKLQDWFTVPPVHSPPISQPAVQDSRDASPSGGNKPLSFALSHIDCSHPYLAGRGIDSETARYFGIGYHHGKGSMAGRVVVPIHDENAFLVAYAGRSVDGTDPKYRFPPRFRKSLVLFNLHRASTHGESVVVVEGFFDCIRVHQAGLPGVVALMGSSLSIQQEELLQDHFREIILLLDGDKAGRTAGTTISKQLVAKLSTKLIEVPDGMQPDQIGPDQIRSLISMHSRLLLG